jgi:hypothetical protein
MSASERENSAGSPRRGLFGRAAAAFALGAAAVAGTTARAQAAPSSDEPNWPGEMKGRYHQVFDGVSVPGGNALHYAANFLESNPPGTATSVLVLRALALVIAMNDDIWAKYKIGEAFDITDPETKAKAVKNPFLRPKPGVLGSDEMAIDRLLANGVVIGACNMALHGLSKAAGAKIAVNAEDAAREWIAGAIPGITIIPSGVWGVNRAQMAGCTYCAGG